VKFYKLWLAVEVVQVMVTTAAVVEQVAAVVHQISVVQLLVLHHHAHTHLLVL
jgi:DNA-binding FrmR family transcriptional regulator